MTKVFSLTGSIACGKSTASSFIAKQNIPIIDADQVAREVVVKESVGLHQLIDFFGKEILLEDQSLDRNKLGTIVFSDPEKLEKLNSILHPLISGNIENKISLLTSVGVELICLDAALLIETKMHEKFRPLIVVSCSPKTQLARLMKRNNLSEEEAKRRIEAQLSSSQKEKYADFIIDSNGTLEQSEEQVLKIINQIKNGKVS